MLMLINLYQFNKKNYKTKTKYYIQWWGLLSSSLVMGSLSTLVVGWPSSLVVVTLSMQVGGGGGGWCRRHRPWWGHRHRR